MKLIQGIRSAINAVLTSYTSGANTALANTDTVVGAFGKVQGQLDAKAPLVSPSFTTPALGTPSSGVLTNCTGTATGLTAGALSTETIARLTSTFTTSSTTLVDVTGMNVAMLANKDYIVEIDILFQSTQATTGLWFSLNGPASPTAVAFQSIMPLTATTNNVRNNAAYDGGTSGGDVPAANTTYYARMQGIIRNGANAGDLQFRVAAENANNVSVRIGSVIKITQTN